MSQKLNYSTFGHLGLSYSRVNAFHECARKFEISHVLGLARREDSVTFAYGHAVAAGVQEIFKSNNLTQAILACVKWYSMPWDDFGTEKERKAKKNVWFAAHAVENFYNKLNVVYSGDLIEFKNYELVWFDHEGKSIPAIELEFKILLPNGYVYEGHVDLILRNKSTGEIVVFEMKTTKYQPVSAMFKNSPQALGYSIILDKIAQVTNHEGIASYRVIYLVYSSSQMDWTVFKFPKSAKRRLNWLNDLIRLTDVISYYQAGADEGIPYPTNGNSCNNFFKPCEYLNLCELENDTLIKLLKVPNHETQFEEKDQAHFIFTYEEVADMQIALAAERTGAFDPLKDITI